MKDSECVQFLQWALPHLRMRWPGFRKVRGQVCKRLDRRLKQLSIADIGAYKNYLEDQEAEWVVLDELVRVTVSRFYRDKSMFAFLEQTVLPELVEQVIERGEGCLRIWSVGCGAGEEPYTIALIWILRLQSRFPDINIEVVATDADPNMIRRAQEARYPYSSIKNLPKEWREKVFIIEKEQYCLKHEYRRDIRFLKQDVRAEMPADKFDLILCRNLVFTYFDDDIQCQVFERLKDVIQSGGALVIGIHENLPERTAGFEIWSDRLRIYRF